MHRIFGACLQPRSPRTLCFGMFMEGVLRAAVAAATPPALATASAATTCGAGATADALSSWFSPARAVAGACAFFAAMDAAAGGGVFDSLTVPLKTAAKGAPQAPAVAPNGSAVAAQAEAPSETALPSAAVAGTEEAVAAAVVVAEVVSAEVAVVEAAAPAAVQASVSDDPAQLLRSDPRAVEALFAQQRGIAALFRRHAGVVVEGAVPAVTRAGFDALLSAHEIFAAPWAEVKSPSALDRLLLPLGHRFSRRPPAPFPLAPVAQPRALRACFRPAAPAATGAANGSAPALSPTEFTLCLARLAFVLFGDAAFADEYPLPSDKLELLFLKLDEDGSTAGGSALFDGSQPAEADGGADDGGEHRNRDHEHEWV
jgi:hypothetical protein